MLEDAKHTNTHVRTSLKPTLAVKLMLTIRPTEGGKKKIFLNAFILKISHWAN